MNLPPLSRTLGVAGLIPQGAFVVAALVPEWRYVGVAGGWLYAALIFTFLGGIWWGQALTAASAPRWLWAAAVAPSLIALASGVPWMVGGRWPGPSLIVLGAAILLSPLIDRAVARHKVAVPEGWQRLRWTLSAGLGAATLLLGVLA